MQQCVNIIINKYLENKNIPTELYKESTQLKGELQADDENTIIPRNHIDDEYAGSLYRDPSIVMTTSRDPRTRLMQF